MNVKNKLTLIDHKPNCHTLAAGFMVLLALKYIVLFSGFRIFRIFIKILNYVY